MHTNLNHLTLNKFFEEVEHYIEIFMLAIKAKHKLNTIVMQFNKSMNEYYCRLFKLWEDANTLTDERMKKFKLMLKLNTSHVLLTERHNSLRKLLAIAKSIEEEKKKINNNFLQDSKLLQKPFKP